MLKNQALIRVDRGDQIHKQQAAKKFGRLFELRSSIFL
jgi:hypothetical protein